jgi:hypothetical protein
MTLAKSRTDPKSDDISRLEAIVADQQKRLDVLEARQPAPAPDGGDTKEQRSTRRQMLKLAGATLVGAAGAAALKAVPASAVNGSPLVVGTVSTQDLNNSTGISLIGASGANPIFEVVAYGASGTGGSAIAAGAKPNGTGVIGYAGGTFGIGGRFSSYGGTFSIGMLGKSGAGKGVYGLSYNGTGVYATTVGQSQRALYAYTAATGSVAIFAASKRSAAISAASNTSYALVAKSGATQSNAALILGSSATYTGLGVGNIGGGPDLKLGGSGRIVQRANISAGVSGAPSYTPRAAYFEMIRKGDGGLWVSKATPSVGQAAWKPINAVRVDTADGTGAPFKPVRIIDTRSGAIKAPGSVTHVPVAGVGTGASHIPSTAIAVMGNVAAIGYAGAGFLAVMPDGIVIGTGPGQYNQSVDPSSINFIVGQYAIANSFVCGLNAGMLQVFVGSLPGATAAHFVIDITCYLE